MGIRYAVSNRDNTFKNRIMVEKEGKKIGDGYYSIKTAAILLDCSEQFFRNLVRDRKITFVKFGRMVRIPVLEIEKLKIEYQSISAIYDKAIAK